MRQALVVPADASHHVVDLDPSASATLERWIGGEFAPLQLTDRLILWVNAGAFDAAYAKINVQAGATIWAFGWPPVPVWGDVVYTGSGADPAALDDDWLDALVIASDLAAQQAASARRAQEEN